MKIGRILLNIKHGQMLITWMPEVWKELNSIFDFRLVLSKEYE